MPPVYCGDCMSVETETKQRGRRLYRVCPSCKTETRLTLTGKAASSRPNLQNIPIRTPEGKRIRDAFVTNRPSDIDYSAVEESILETFQKMTGIPSRFTGGGVQNACHTCGNSFAECIEQGTCGRT